MNDPQLEQLCSDVLSVWVCMGFSCPVLHSSFFIHDIPNKVRRKVFAEALSFTKYILNFKTVGKIRLHYGLVHRYKCFFLIHLRPHVPREFFTDIFFAWIIYFYLLNQASSNLSTSCNKFTNFIMLQQANQACCKLSFADLLQLVETTCSKPVDNMFWQSHL